MRGLNTPVFALLLMAPSVTVLILLILFSSAGVARAESEYVKQFQACVSKLRTTNTGSKGPRQWGGSQNEIDYMSICQAMLGDNPNDQPQEPGKATLGLSPKKEQALLGNLLGSPGNRPDRK